MAHHVDLVRPAGGQDASHLVISDRYWSQPVLGTAPLQQRRRIYPVMPLVTEVVPLEHFYKAEDYHQGYFRANPEQAYCQGVVAPKVAKFRQKFAAKMKR